MDDRRQEEEANYMYFRTTCGLVGFIVFFLITFLSFILAEETGKYYEYAIIFGFAMLFATSLSFCCLLHESKRVYSIPTQASQWLPLDALQPQPEPELPTGDQQGPHWADNTRHDLGYARSVHGLHPRDSEDTADSKDETDSDVFLLQNISKYGIDPEYETIAEAKKGNQGRDSRYEGASDVPSHSAKAGPSKVAGQSSKLIESGSDVSPVEGISSLSLSDSSKSTTESGEKENVSAALSKLSLVDSEKQAAKRATQDPSSAHSEGKSDEGQPQYAIISKKKKEVKSDESEPRYAIISKKQK